MKAKKMTQQLALLTFSALFIAFMFNACSDVAGPEDNADDDSIITQQEFDRLFDISSHANNRRAGVPAGEGDDYVCGSNTVILGAGRNANPIGNVSYTIGRGGIVVSVDAPGYTITNIRTWVYTDPEFTEDIMGNNLNQGDRYDPSFPSGVSSHTFLIPYSEAGILPGEDFYLIVSVSAEINENNGSGVTSYGGNNDGQTGGNFWRYTTFVPCSVNGGSVG